MDDFYFVDWLRPQIKARFKTTANFAREAGLNITSFYSIVDDVRAPGPYTLSKIFAALGTPEEERKEIVYHLWNDLVVNEMSHRG